MASALTYWGNIYTFAPADGSNRPIWAGAGVVDLDHSLIESVGSLFQGSTLIASWNRISNDDIFHFLNRKRVGSNATVPTPWHRFQAEMLPDCDKWGPTSTSHVGSATGCLPPRAL